MTVEDNVRNSKLANEVYELAVSMEGTQHFWVCLSTLVANHLPPPKILKKNLPMTKEEARQFEMRAMPFGKYKGVQIKGIDLELLTFYSDISFSVLVGKYVEYERKHGHDC